MGPEALGSPSSLQFTQKVRVETQAQAPGVTGLHSRGGTLSPPLATPPPGFLEVDRSSNRAGGNFYILSPNRTERSIY